MLEFIGNNVINLIALALSVLVALAGLVYLALRPRFFWLAVKNLWRNPLRTALISFATMVLVVVVTLIWTIIYSLSLSTQAKSENLKIIITEKYQLPSRMPFNFINYLDPDSPQLLEGIRKLNAKYGEPIYTKKDFMTWSFFGGSTDIKKKDLKNFAFFFCMEADSIRSMMDDLEDIDEDLIRKLKENDNGVLLGGERIKTLKLQIGDNFELDSMNFKDIKMKLKLVGKIPDVGRYNQAGIMNVEYFKKAFDKYKSDVGKNLTDHPDVSPDRRLNLIWIRVKNQERFNELAKVIDESGVFFSERPIKVETGSSAIASFIEPYQDILTGVKLLLVPAILLIMTLVVSIAISISVRERRTELAVMKVLGFKPMQILYLVMAESLFLAVMSGFVAGFGVFAIVNWGFKGVSFPIAFFPAFLIPSWALAWGPAMGCLTALMGSVLPAWNARNVKVSEVFAKVA